MPYLETPDHVPLYYDDFGPKSDQVIFLVHPAPFNSQAWRHSVVELSSRFRVLAVDLRGFGRSGKGDDGHYLAQYARDIRYVFEILSLRRVLVVGWSLGASVLFEYIRQFSGERLVGFVDVDQRPYNFISEYRFEKEVNDVRIRRLAHLKEKLLYYFGPEVCPNEDTINEIAYECMKTPTSVWCSIAYDSTHVDYRPMLSKIRIPTRIFWSRYGNITAESAKMMQETIPDCQLVFFPYSGHYLVWTESRTFNLQVLNFAKEIFR